MLPFLASVILQTNSTLPGPIANVPGLSSQITLVLLSVVLGYCVGFAIKKGLAAGGAVIVIFVILYFVGAHSFPASVVGDLIPLIKSIAESIYAIVSEGGLVNIAAFGIGAALAYFQIGLQQPVKRPD